MKHHAKSIRAFVLFVWIVAILGTFLLIGLGCQTPQSLADHAHADYAIALKATDQLAVAHKLSPDLERRILATIPTVDIALDALDVAVNIRDKSTFDAALQSFYRALADLNALAQTGSKP